MLRLPLLVALLILAGCAGRPRTDEASLGSGASFDRALQERAVYETVMRHAARPKVRRFVLDPNVEAGRMGGTLSLPARVRRDTLADLRVRPAGRVPRDLDVGLPVEWFTQAEWEALPVTEEGYLELDARWNAFHARFPDSAGWMTFTAVGFSADGRQALVHVGQSYASLGARGYYVLLAHKNGTWRVIEEATTAVA